MRENQTKSRERVREYGEVFTAEREVKAMCDLVKDEIERLKSRCLEPACGTGNFLVEILNRKLAVCKATYGKDLSEYEKMSVLVITTLYGVDIMFDNVITCRERLFEIWDREYLTVCKEERNEQTREAVRFILSRNIICGNTLTQNCVDENGNETEEPIIFSEWELIGKTSMQRQERKFLPLGIVIYLMMYGVYFARMYYLPPI